MELETIPTLTARNTVHCERQLSPNEESGIDAIIVCSFLSLTAVSITIGFYVRNIMRNHGLSSNPRPAFRAIDLYFLALLFSDFLVAFSGLLNIRWVISRKSFCGTYCSAQGFLSHIGLPAIGISSMMISFHTFSTIVLQWTSSPTRTAGILILISMWMFLICISLVPAVVYPHYFYAPSPIWCYVNNQHIYLRGSGYFCAWIAGFTSIFLYSLLWYRLRHPSPIMRFIDRDSPGRNRRRYNEGTPSSNENSLLVHAWRDTWKLLCYPAIYMVIILPLSVTRWTSFVSHTHNKHHEVPFSATVFSVALYKPGGLFDVILFITTRPGLLLFESRDSSLNIPGIRRISQHITNELLYLPWLTRSGSVETSVSSTGFHRSDLDNNCSNQDNQNITQSNQNPSVLNINLHTYTEISSSTTSLPSLYQRPSRHLGSSSECPIIAVDIPTSRLSGIKSSVSDIDSNTDTTTRIIEKRSPVINKPDLTATSVESALVPTSDIKHACFKEDILKPSSNDENKHSRQDGEQNAESISPSSSFCSFCSRTTPLPTLDVRRRKMGLSISISELSPPPSTSISSIAGIRYSPPRDRFYSPRTPATNLESIPEEHTNYGQTSSTYLTSFSNLDRKLYQVSSPFLFRQDDSQANDIDTPTTTKTQKIQRNSHSSFLDMDDEH